MYFWDFLNFQLRFVISIYFWPDTEVWLDSNLVLVLTQLMLWCVRVERRCLHARAEGLQLMVEVLGGFRQNQGGVQAGVPDAAETQWNLLHQVVHRVALHVHRLVRVEVDARLRDGQDAKAGASQPRDGHQVMGPYSVT